jgi:3-oxoacyl-[acyl-carrier protein] reductase
MADAYLNVVNSKLGHPLSRWLGLPQPVPLDRHQPGQPVVEGDVLMAATPDPELQATLVQACQSMQLATLAHRSLPTWTAQANASGLLSGPWNLGDQPGGRIKALVLDATGLRTVAQSQALHQCLNETVQSLLPCGRVLVLGRPPQSAPSVEQAAVQRALLGLVKSLAKELRRGITAQLLAVAPGAEAQLEGCLRFLLSPRSAYVSGQCLTLEPAPPITPVDWHRPLAQQTLMVTGAARGIGAAIAATLARDGARVVCVDVPQAETELQQVADRIQGRALALDITAPDAPALIVQAAMADGGWSGVVHNAGITRDKTIGRMPAHLWQSLMQVNLSAALHINQALLDAQALRPAARLVAVSSISGIAGNLGQTNYAFSKAGVIGMVQAQAPHLPAGMAINAVAPGFIETQMTASIPWMIREAGRRMNAMGQGGQPVDVAEAIGWLISPAAQGIQAQVLRVCGMSWLGA